MADIYVALHCFIRGKILLYSPAKLEKKIVDLKCIKDVKIGSWYKISNCEKSTMSITEVRAPLDTRFRRNVLEVKTLMIFFEEPYCEIVGHSLGFGTVANFLTNKLARNVVYRGWIAYMEPFPCSSFRSVLDAIGCAWALVETPKEIADSWQKISTINGLNLDTAQGIVVVKMSDLRVEILNVIDGQLYTSDQPKLRPGDFVNFTPVHFSVKSVVRKKYAFDPRLDLTWERNMDIKVVEREPQLKILVHNWDFGDDEETMYVIDVPSLHLINLWFKNDDKRKLAALSPKIGEPIVVIYDLQDRRFYLDDMAVDCVTDIENHVSNIETCDEFAEVEFQSRSSIEQSRFLKSADTYSFSEEKTVKNKIEFEKKSFENDESQCQLSETMSKTSSLLVEQSLVCSPSKTNGEKIVESETECRPKLSPESPKTTLEESRRFSIVSELSSPSDVSSSSKTANKEEAVKDKW